MKKSLFMSSGALAVMTMLFLIGCQKPTTESQVTDKNASEIVNSHDEIVAFDNDFNIYRSQTKSYSVKIPKEMRIQSCATESGYDMVPVTVLSNQKFDYIVPAEYYVSPNGVCSKVDMDFDNAENWWIGSWKIVIADAANDAEIDKFIKQEYGPGCAMAQRTLADKGSIFDVVIRTTGPDEPEDKLCFINYGYEIKYNDIVKKVAKWDIGQDANFYDKNGNELDTKMAESFVFEGNL